jgi:hypothetical protein
MAPVTLISAGFASAAAWQVRHKPTPPPKMTRTWAIGSLTCNRLPGQTYGPRSCPTVAATG